MPKVNRIELVARPGKSVQKANSQKYMVVGCTKVEMIKIALVVRPVPKKAVDRP